MTQTETTQKEVVGISCTNPKDHPSNQAWRLSFNGRVLGDSRGYSKDRAIEEARRQVNRSPDHFTLSPEIA